MAQQIAPEPLTRQIPADTEAVINPSNTREGLLHDIEGENNQTLQLKETIAHQKKAIIELKEERDTERAKERERQKGDQEEIRKLREKLNQVEGERDAEKRKNQSLAEEIEKMKGEKQKYKEKVMDGIESLLNTVDIQSGKTNLLFSHVKSEAVRILEDDGSQS